MVKHAPGPWHANGNLILGGTFVAKVFYEKGKKDLMLPLKSQADANAALIAAAPDLLAALDAIMAYMPSFLEHWVKSDPLVVKRVNQARAAIAKAEGRGL